MFFSGFSLYLKTSISETLSANRIIPLWILHYEDIRLWSIRSIRHHSSGHVNLTGYGIILTVYAVKYCGMHHAYARTLRSIRTFLEAAPSETTWRNWRNVSLNGKCSLLLSHAWWLTSAYRLVDIETSGINGLEANQKSKARESDQIYDHLHVDVIVKFLWTPNRLVDVIHRTVEHATEQPFICKLLKTSYFPKTLIVPIR